MGCWELRWRRRRQGEDEHTAIVCVIGAVAGLLTVGLVPTAAFAAGAAASTIHRRGGFDIGAIE